MQKPLNILVLATYFKGERFMEQAHRRGANVYLLTAAKCLSKPWPRNVLKDVFALPDDATLQNTIHAVSYLARTIAFDLIVPMDDYDVETAASLREHLRLPGMGDTTARHFRDKLAMRVKAAEAGVPVPEFVHVLNHDAIRDFTRRVPAPWMLKPRSEASATGITRVESEEQLWKLIEGMGDRQSYYVLERYIPGDVYHVDAIVSEREVKFAATHRCGKPPFDVAHGGGLFTSSTIPYRSEDERNLRRLNEKVLRCMNMMRGVSHVEFIKSKEDGRFYLLECASRVGGAHIADMVESSCGINLWEEWANIEIDQGKVPYRLPTTHRQEYGGLIITLAKQQKPDLSAYVDNEITYRAPDEGHAGLVIRSKDHSRVQTLLADYQRRFLTDFHAVMPAAQKPAN